MFAKRKIISGGFDKFEKKQRALKIFADLKSLQQKHNCNTNFSKTDCFLEHLYLFMLTLFDEYFFILAKVNLNINIVFTFLHDYFHNDLIKYIF